MQKSRFLNSVDFALVVSVFVALCNIFSNIIVKLNSSLMKRSVALCIFSFCSRWHQSLGVPDAFSVYHHQVTALWMSLWQNVLLAFDKTSKASSLCDKHYVLVTAPEDLAAHCDSLCLVSYYCTKLRMLRNQPALFCSESLRWALSPYSMMQNLTFKKGNFRTCIGSETDNGVWSNVVTRKREPAQLLQLVLSSF